MTEPTVTRLHRRNILSGGSSGLFCQLHTTELKLMRLIRKKNGNTSSKDGWEGELEKLLLCVHSFYLVNALKVNLKKVDRLVSKLDILTPN